MDTKTKAEKDRLKPLAAPSPAIIPINGDKEGDAAVGWWRSVRHLRKSHCALWGCGLTVVLLGIATVILSFTVFKVKDPTLTMNSISLTNLDVNTSTTPMTLNATLAADISIKNPNAASFKFDKSTTEFNYQGETVGVAYAPNGKVSAHRTVRMNVTVDVLVDRVVMQTNGILSLITGQELNLTSSTAINGRVSVLGIYKRDIYLMLNCAMNLELSTLLGEISNTVCTAYVK